MHLIDRYAYSNRLRQVYPAYKIVLAAGVVLLCLLFNRLIVSLVALGWMLFLVTFAARVPIRMFAALLTAEALFLLVSLLGIIFSISVTMPAANLSISSAATATVWSWPLGPLWVSTSADALSLAATIGLRSLAAVSALNFLMLTTPMTDFFDQLRRWRMPELLIDLMSMVYRSIFVLLESMERMIRSQQSRLGYAGRRQAMHSAAMVGAQLFMDAYRRSARVQVALDSRGYDGSLRVLPASYLASYQWLWVCGVIISSLLLVGAYL